MENSWWNVFRLWTYAMSKGPLDQQDDNDLDGAGVLNPESIPDIRGDGSYWSGGKSAVRLHDSNEIVDMSTVSNRPSRYKEYERLRLVPEVETVMTVFADEACVAADTIVQTPTFGQKTIQWLAENKADERFLVYCWDFEKEDFNLGWGFNPRKTGTRETVKITLDDGTSFTVTPDHRVLLRNQEWIEAGKLNYGSELMAFYRIPPNHNLNPCKTNQFPRIFTHAGWTHERFFVDKWRTGTESEHQTKVNRAIRAISQGLPVTKVALLLANQWKTVELHIKKAGFSHKEIKWLSKKSDRRRVIGIQKMDAVDVYDLSVEGHQCFASESVIFHNCQTGENNHVCEIKCEDSEVKEESEHLLFSLLDIDRPQFCWNRFKQLCIMGDEFWEKIMDPDDPSKGIVKIQPLPADSMYRIETTRGRLVEFQQSKDGPDYNSLMKSDIRDATDQDLQQCTALRFSPDQIVHMRINDDRKTFYPYGVSLIEPARGPAHQLHMMEDAMMVYRLSRAPERRVFYIDVGNLAPYRAEAFMERMKDMFKKKKAPGRAGLSGASGVEERWHAPSADEDYWIPLRPNSNTRVETLPGAQNLGEIDDALYFRNKLFIALNFPKNYLSNEDPNATRITLSAQDVKFARLVERLQSSLAYGLTDVIKTHLKLKGFPEESYEDLKVQMTPPSDWRELSRAEVTTNRINNAGSLKGSQLLSDYDILVQWMKHTEDEAKEMIARMKIQKMEELKMQIIAQNPQLIGVGLPGEGDEEVGADGQGPNPMLAPPPEDGIQMPPDQGGAPPLDGPKGMSPDDGQEEMGTEEPSKPKRNAVGKLPEANDEDIKKYDLQIQNFATEQDFEDIDYSELP